MAAAAIRLNSRNLEIKTKSIEQTLVPLVSQITILVNHKEKYAGKAKSEKTVRAVMKVGATVQAAVERFVTVGESIADENLDIQPEMYDACQEARAAGAAIASLSTVTTAIELNATADKQILVRAARQLLSSVTRVLLLADRVLVKQILKATDKVAFSLTRLENTLNFTEFVKIFTQFGSEMVDLAHKTGDRQNDLKSEKRKAQMHVARNILEKYTMLLLTSSKSLLRHPECESARQTRDGVFRGIRTALQLIGLCICDGVIVYDPSRYIVGAMLHDDEPLDISVQLTAHIAISHLTDTIEMVRMTSLIGAGVRERLLQNLDVLCDMTEDFTDSAYTPHHHREQILDFLEEAKLELSQLLKPECIQEERLAKEIIDSSVVRLAKTLKDLRKELQIVAMDQVSEVFRLNEDQVILNSIKTCSVAGDIDGVEHFIDKFREHSEHMQEVCRLLHHISLNDTLHAISGHAERSLRALAPLTVLCGRTLCLHPSSRIARENLEIFCDTWGQTVNELSVLAKDCDATLHGAIAAEKQAYMSLPKPGVNNVRNESRVVAHGRFSSHDGLSMTSRSNAVERSPTFAAAAANCFPLSDTPPVEQDAARTEATAGSRLSSIATACSESHDSEANCASCALLHESVAVRAENTAAFSSRLSRMILSLANEQMERNGGIIEQHSVATADTVTHCCDNVSQNSLANGCDSTHRTGRACCDLTSVDAQLDAAVAALIVGMNNSTA